MSVARAIHAMRYQIMAFAEADTDADSTLNFNDWCSLMRPLPGEEPRSEATLLSWFELACASGGGEAASKDGESVTFYDWLMLVLRCEAQRNRDEKGEGGSLLHLFRRFDKEGTNSLNPIEWGKAAEEIGFLRFATPLFIQLDRDELGTLEHQTLFDAAHTQAEDETMKQLLTAMEDLVPTADRPKRIQIDAALNDALKALDASELRRNINQHLAACDARVSDLIILLADRAMMNLSAREWREAMQRLGYKGSTKLLEQIFTEATKPDPTQEDELLTASSPHNLLKSLHDKYLRLGSGSPGGTLASATRRQRGTGSKSRCLNFDELYEWLHSGKRSCLDTRKVMAELDLSKLRFSLTVDKKGGEPRDLKALDWSLEATLRSELQRVCRDHDLSPSELMWHCA